MASHRFRPICLALLSLLAVGGSSSERAGANAPKALTAAAAKRTYAKQPLRFEANVGQSNAPGAFIARGRGTSMSFDGKGATLAFASNALSLHVAGGREVTPVASDELVTKINYLRGNDTSKWQRNVATYGTLTYPSVLDGVDMVFHGEAGQVEYDFVVAPGADPSTIAVEIGGGTGLSLTKDGDLAIATGHGTVLQHRPRMFQGQTEIDGRYRLAGDGRVAFEVGAYDHDQALVIDPVIGYATLLGGGSSDSGYGIALDGETAYVTGQTDDYTSFTPPATNEIRGEQLLRVLGTGPLTSEFQSDAFVAKLDGTGAVQWLTIYGGTGSDSANGIAVDANHRVYFGGETESFDLKTTSNAAFTSLPSAEGQFGFVASLNTDGSDVTYATFVSDRATVVQAIAVDGAGNVYAGGSSSSIGEDSLPNGFWVGKLSTPTDATPGTETDAFLGGGGFAWGVALHDGKVYAGGFSDDPEGFGGISAGNEGTMHSFADAAVTALDANTLDVTWGRFFGTDAQDFAYAMAVGVDGHVYLAGSISNLCEGPCTSDPSPFPATVGTGVLHDNNAWVASIDPATSAVVYARLFNGNDDAFGSYEEIDGIALDAQGRAFLVGDTQDNDFNGVPNATGETGNEQGIIVALDPTGQSLYTRYYDSTISDDVLWAVAANTSGIFVTGYSDPSINEESDTVGPGDDLPDTTGAMRSGQRDVIVARLTLDPVTITPSAITLFPGNLQTFSAGGGIGTGGFTYTLAANGSNGSIDPVTGIYKAGTKVGTDLVRAVDILGSAAVANVTVTDPESQQSVLVLTPVTTQTSPRGGVQFVASGGAPPYVFAFNVNGSNGTLTDEGHYTAGARGSVTDRIIVTDTSGQAKSASIAVGPGVKILPLSPTVAPKGTLQLTATGGTGSGYQWSVPQGQGSISATGAFTAPTTSSTIIVTVRDPLGNTATTSVSVGAGLSISPNEPDTYPRGTIQFSAVGGSAPYSYAVVTPNNAGGGTINANGVFTAGPTGNVTETIDVKDSVGTHRQTQIHVGAGLAITPGAATAASNAQVQFGATGGSGEGYAFSVESAPSGGSVNAQSGLYTAGAGTGTDVVKLVDSANNDARANVVVSTNGTGGTSSGSSAPPISSADGSSSGNLNLGSGNGGGSDDSCSTTGTPAGAMPWLLAIAGIAAVGSRRRRRR